MCVYFHFLWGNETWDLKKKKYIYIYIYILLEHVSFVLRDVFHSGGLKNERAKKLVCECVARVKLFSGINLFFLENSEKFLFVLLLPSVWKGEMKMSYFQYFLCNLFVIA